MAIRRVCPSVYLALALALGIGVALSMALAGLGSQQVAWPAVGQRGVAVDVPHWLSGSQATLREGLLINSHAAKHAGEVLDAWRLQELLGSQRCVASRRYCRMGGELYLCVDPASGLIGGLIVVGDEIISGYAGGEGYWRGKIVDEWEGCGGRVEHP